MSVVVIFVLRISELIKRQASIGKLKLKSYEYSSICCARNLINPTVNNHFGILLSNLCKMDKLKRVLSGNDDNTSNEENRGIMNDVRVKVPIMENNA